MRRTLILSLLFLVIGFLCRLWVYDGVDTVENAENVAEGAIGVLLVVTLGIGFTVASVYAFIISFGFFVLFLLIGVYRAGRWGWRKIKKAENERVRT